MKRLWIFLTMLVILSLCMGTVAYIGVKEITTVRAADTTPVTGITTEVTCDILPGVSITLDGMGQVVSDQAGQFQIMATAIGNLTVTAHKDGFRDRTQTINIAGLGPGYAVTCNFQGNHGLIPCAPLWGMPSNA